MPFFSSTQLGYMPSPCTLSPQPSSDIYEHYSLGTWNYPLLPNLTYAHSILQVPGTLPSTQSGGQLTECHKGGCILNLNTQYILKLALFDFVQYFQQHKGSQQLKYNIQSGFPILKSLRKMVLQKTLLLFLMKLLLCIFLDGSYVEIFFKFVYFCHSLFAFLPLE